MSLTKGYAAQVANGKIEPWEFQRREVGSNDISIDIEFSGICHSDIHQVKEEWGKAIFPMVPGHEIVGTVTAVGANVSKFKVGDRRSSHRGLFGFPVGLAEKRRRDGRSPSRMSERTQPELRERVPRRPVPASIAG